jgi:exodeoxyribonuclease VII large subunit
MSQPSFDFGPEPGDDDEPLDDAANPTLTVGELADEINRALRRSFLDGVWVRGEIHDLSERNGHLYLTLADDAPGRKAVLRVQFFANARARLRPLLTKHRLRLSVGMKVRVYGHLDYYGPGGSIGLKMTDLDPRYTLGDLAQQRDQIVRRLVADGAIDANKRRRLSAVPLRIGVVSSEGTAAWHDFHEELRSSGLGFHVVLANTPVQGPTASRAVTSALVKLSHHAVVHGLDAIVVIRGGGARNELAVFDAEPIARAIAAAPVPVLTGLGHEIDRSVADECAHTSYKTPTACAAALVHAVAGYLDEAEQCFAAITNRAGTALVAAEGRLTDRARRIGHRTHAAVERADERLTVRVERLHSHSDRAIVLADRHLDTAARRLVARLPGVLANEDRHLTSIEARVRVLDPAHLLARGWSITRRDDGTVVRNPADVAPGDVLSTQIAGGSVSSRVERSEPT